MAHALGYHEASVREAFGRIEDTNKGKDKKQLTLLFDQLWNIQKKKIKYY